MAVKDPKQLEHALSLVSEVKIELFVGYMFHKDIGSKVGNIVNSIPERIKQGRMSMVIQRSHELDYIEDFFSFSSFFDKSSKTAKNLELNSLVIETECINEKKQPKMGLISAKSFVNMLKFCKTLEMN